MREQAVTTAEQLLGFSELHCRHELVRGELRRLPFATVMEADVTMVLLCKLHPLLGPDQQIHGPGTGFWLDRNPDTVRCPDVGVIYHGPGTPMSDEFVKSAPEIAIEVVASTDSFDDVIDKTHYWLEHGTPLVWIVDPENQNVTVYDSTRNGRILSGGDELTAGEVVPGFCVPVCQLFPST